MKKVVLMITMTLMVASLAFAEGNDKGKRKRGKAKTCCSHNKTCSKK